MKNRNRYKISVPTCLSTDNQQFVSKPANQPFPRRENREIIWERGSGTYFTSDNLMETAQQKHAEDIATFQQVVKKGLADPFAYDRLMIYYRKAKDYAKELAVINKAINVFQTQLEKLRNKSLARNKKRPAIEKLSQTINKSTGLTDKKGKATFIPEPIAKWLKRKIIVEKKIAAA